MTSLYIALVDVISSVSGTMIDGNNSDDDDGRAGKNEMTSEGCVLGRRGNIGMGNVIG